MLRLCITLFRCVSLDQSRCAHSDAAFIWTGDHGVSHLTGELRLIDFTTGERRLWTGDFLSSVHHLWKRKQQVEKSCKVINWQKYVFNETIVHVVWCVLLYCLPWIVKWTLSIYMVVFTSSKWEIHQNRINAA